MMSTNLDIPLAFFMVVSDDRSEGIKMDHSRLAIGFLPDAVDKVVNMFYHFVEFVPLGEKPRR